MSVSPTGPLGLAIDSVKYMLSQCAEIQTMLGTVSQATTYAAIGTIQTRGVIAPPTVFITADTVRIPQTALGNWAIGASTEVWFAWSQASQAVNGDTLTDAAYRAMNRFDAIINQCQTLISSQATGLPFAADFEGTYPILSGDDDKELARCWTARLTINVEWK